MKKETKKQQPCLNAVSGSFMCAHGAENKCKEQCYTCSEDEKCDVKYSYKSTIGCPQCGSKNYKEEGNNHHQTDDEMEYLEYYKCQDCGHGFVL